MTAAADSVYALAPRWLVTMAPTGQVLEEHVVVVESGRVAAVLPRAELAGRYSGIDVRELPDHALMPGLINMHTHSAMSLLRGLADDLPLMTWLEDHIWPAETACVGHDYARDGMELAVAEMLRCGVTCFNDNYFFPDIAAAVARKAGIRATLGLPIIKVPTAWAKTADEYFSRGLEVYEELRGDPLLRVAFAPHAPYTVSDESFTRISQLAAEMDVRVHLHLHETDGEVASAVAMSGMRPMARMTQLGLMNERLIAVHMTQLNDAEIDQLVEHGVHVAHCPESNLKLGSGVCPTAELMARGVNVCLGTDGAASNNDLDMWGEMRSAAFLAKGSSRDPQVLPAAEVLAMATINGARALGIADETGSIEVGKSADFCAINLDEPETQPVHHVISTLVYAAARHQVSDVWVAGRQLLAQRRLQTLDEADIKRRAATWSERLKQWA
ncbi:MAG: TRZ/ATZ family hydrolase [Wenzhouxiangellaceae bacterium]